MHYLRAVRRWSGGGCQTSATEGQQAAHRATGGAAEQAEPHPQRHGPEGGETMSRGGDMARGGVGIMGGRHG